VFWNTAVGRYSEIGVGLMVEVLLLVGGSGEEVCVQWYSGLESLDRRSETGELWDE
jgi:hypothetical protein